MGKLTSGVLEGGVVAKFYLLSVRFEDMGPEDSIFLTDAGQPFKVEEGYLAEYVGYLKQGEGFLGDLFNVYGDNWHVAAVFAHELGPRIQVFCKLATLEKRWDRDQD